MKINEILPITKDRTPAETGGKHASGIQQARHNWLDLRKELLIFFAIVVLGSASGMAFIGASPVKKFHFYQETYAPAVMAACGKGFVQPRPEPESMTAFLKQRSDTFDCRMIHADTESFGPGFFQMGHRNLMLTVAGWWRMFGVSWGSLASLYGLLYGISAGFAYVLFRTVVKRPLALGLVCFFILSPPQLFNLPHLRDYAKAPFMLAAIAVIAWLLKGGLSRTAFISILAATGLLIGIGIGFRIDLLILVPLLLAVILFFQPGPLFGNMKSRIGGAAAFLVCFMIAASPTLMNLSGGSNIPHLIVLGLMGEFDQRLGLNPAFYELGYHYLDMYANTIVNAYAYGGGYEGTTITYPSQLYDLTGSAYIIDVFKNFPADIFARYLAAIWRILHLPITAVVTFEDVYFFYDNFRPDWLMRFVHAPLWDVGLSVAMLAGGLLLALRNFKLLLGAIIVIAYLCGYPFLQFGVRHYFFLEVIGLWLLGLCIQGYRPTSIRQWWMQFGTAVPTAIRFWQSRQFVAQGLYVVKVAILVFGLPFVVLCLLRVYQVGHLQSVFEAYASIPTRPFATEQREGPVGRSVLRLVDPMNNMENGPKDVVETLYLTAMFDAKKCGKKAIHACFKYDGADQTFAFTQCKSLGIDANTRVVFPAFFRKNLIAFVGIEMPVEEISCLTSIQQLTAKPELRIPLTMTLPENWIELPRYRTFH
jgi:hypothetical protein